MLGAIIGDIVGSPYEVRNVFKRSEIRPFKDRYIPEIGKCRFTDDTVLTIAVARALEENLEEKNIDIFEKKIAEKLKYYVEKYPLKRDFVNRSLYGSGFEKWAKEKELNKREAYIDEKGNYVSTNGAAMRVASVGWMYSSIEEVLDKAKSTAVYTHGSDESIVAAQAIALSVFVARTTKNKAEIMTSLKTRLGYDIDTSIENLKENVKEIRNSNNAQKGLKVNCDAKTTTQQAIYAFCISNGFSDCIKTAISFGGDSDTIACMAGAIAEAYYGIPQWWIDKAFSILKKEGCYEDDLLFINDFRKKYCLNKY